MIDYKEHITINSEIRFGKAIIIGTRITVFDVLNCLANGMSINEIIADFPELNENQSRFVFLTQQIDNIKFKLHREIAV